MGVSSSTSSTNPESLSKFREGRVQSESTESAAPSIYNKELSCKGHPCPNCGLCRDWYFTGNAAELDWLRYEIDWKYDFDAWNRWCNDRFELKFKPRDGKTCVGHRDVEFLFNIRDFKARYHPKYHPNCYAQGGDPTYQRGTCHNKFPHGPIVREYEVPGATTILYDYTTYYSDFCACEDNIEKQVTRRKRH
ncbi:unnamed protein product [Adineta steineri]|uniref:Uncharacterized protein n=1 Tax=Adineta steineri TaxID=433720 RepID=A0A819R6W0_9BILA|nr:unnamed protein product [Adineta steineri]CAF4042296.1 unnamed protein product [Adineta steineri]